MDQSGRVTFPAVIAVSLLVGVSIGCHSDESAEAILQRSRLEEGNFLIRESRSKDKTYILSLCHENVIKNYRISPDHEGRFALVDTSGLSPVPKTVNSCYNLHDLVNHHHHFKVRPLSCSIAKYSYIYT